MTAERFLYRHFGKILFSVNFLLGLLLWYQGRRLGLFAPPQPGMDQHTILEAALNIPRGLLPQPGKYLYSPSYTLFLGALAAFCNGSLPWMRLLQMAISSLIPWVIYRSAVYANFGRKAGALAGFFWLFCGSALLISLDFLRAAPLALCFIGFFYFLIRSFRRKNDIKYTVLAGIMAGLCMLGRENFIPVICLPILFWILPDRIPARTGMAGTGQKAFARPFRRIGIYLAAALLLMLPVLGYNFYHTSSFAILPGNGRNVFEFMQGKGTLSSPGQAFLLVVKKIPATTIQILTPFENTNSLSVYAHREAVGILKVLCIPVTLLFALTAVLLDRWKRNSCLLLMLISGYFASLLFCEIYYRFRIPALPLLCLGAGAGIIQLYNMFRKKEKKAWLYLLPVGAALYFSFAIVPERLLPRTEREATVRFFLDRKMYDRAGELLLKYRACGVPSPQGERFLLYLLVKDRRPQDAAWWLNRFQEQ